MNKNQQIELEITGTTHEGNGVGRFEGTAVFVPGCAEGDRVRVQIVSVKKTYAYARLLDVVKPSKARIEPDCPVFSRCGGCAFRHIAYDEELRIKATRVRDALSKIGHLEVPVEPTVPSPETESYRNKAQFPVGAGQGRAQIGFYAPRSHRIVETPSCRLQPPAFGKAVAAFRRWLDETNAPVYDEITGSGLVRHLFLRAAGATGEWMACVVANGGALPQSDRLTQLLREAVPGLAGVILNINRQRSNVILGDCCKTLWGRDTITDILCGRKFELSPLSFYQVNRRQAEQLYQTAGEFTGLSGQGVLLDLYCGAGTVGLCLSDRCSQLIGVEVVPQAVEDARRNAALNGVSHARFICADAGEAAARLYEEGLRPDAVVVDPPRHGLDTAGINAILRMAPQRIAYISCDPATLARDLAAFTAEGYACRRVQPFDMFPRTAHVECVVLMSRVENQP